MNKINKSKTTLLLILLLFACNDLWLDKDIYIGNGIIIRYQNGNGYRLVDKSSVDIISTSIADIYKNDSILFVKANPLNSQTDTIYYKIFYNADVVNTHITQIERNLFDSLTINLKEILSSDTSVP